MAYPIQLFDFQTEEGRNEGTLFLQNLDQTLTSLFGIVQINDTASQFHKWDNDSLPDYLKTLATGSVEKMLKQLPEGEMKWRGTVGVYGRKRGSVIKREDDLLYRIIINFGDIEIYYLDGEGFNNEPAVLPNGYALLCSPVMIDKIDIKVRREPLRKNLDPKLAGMVPKIRARKYLRSTIVLDLPNEGLTIPNTDIDIEPSDIETDETDETDETQTSNTD